MKGWTTTEARLVLEWARAPVGERSSIDEVAARLGRSIGAVQQFLRRVLPRGQWPWTEKPRWSPEEIVAVQTDTGSLPARTPAAVKKYRNRRCRLKSDDFRFSDELERHSLTVTQVAADLGVSRASVYRLLDRGVLRRFKGGIAETSFGDLLREHPEVIPYSRLPRDQKEWLVLNGYNDPSLNVRRPSVRGLLD
jgi:transposase